MIRVIHGDSRTALRDLDPESIHCCVTSPPYFGLRDYGDPNQIGQEETPAEFVANLVAVFREVWRVLRDDGTLWLNLGDSYATRPNGPHGVPKPGSIKPMVASRTAHAQRSGRVPAGFRHKDLMGIPWRVAFALQDDGWYLRQDIIWSKPNPMPESVTDRCTKAHEYLFLLSKSPRYYFDTAAIREPASPSSLARLDPSRTERASRDTFRRTTLKAGDAPIPGQRVSAFREGREESDWQVDSRNKRSVWTVPVSPFSGAHFATFPPDLIKPCIQAGCPPDGTVLDPFGGAGTTGLVAAGLGRNGVLVELSAEYCRLAMDRIAGDAPLFQEVAP